MKKIAIAAIILIVVSLIAWLGLPRRTIGPALQQSEVPTSPREAASPETPNSTELDVGGAGRSRPDLEKNPSGWIERRVKQIEADREGSRDEWRTPIEFYGKVVDQNENPISKAEIEFSCNDLTAAGTSTYHTASDNAGLFSITGINGKLLVVTVKKEGYYASNRDVHSFYYAGQNENFVPDPTRPVVFHLRTQGVSDPLAHCKINSHIERDGTPVSIDLLHCSKAAVGQAQLVVECWTDDQGRRPGEHYDWKCRISVPGGGIVQTTNEYDFEAPEKGYKSFDQIKMPETLGSAWHSTEKRKYFAKTADGAFFRFSFEIIAAGDHFFEIESFFNPSGSRNLEFDPGKVVQAGN